MEIITKNNTEKELKAKKLLEEIIQKYNPPIFTKKVMIATGSIPHSHPVLTLNTRDTEERKYLEMFVHEQLHWFAQNQPKYDQCITFLKKRYKDNGECNKSGTYPNSFWEHIIVNFNTRNILNQLLSKDDVDYIYSDWQAYPKTEKLVVDNFKEIKKQIESFGMVYFDKRATNICG